MFKRNFFTLLLIIILAGSFLRFYKLGEVSFVADEFLDINASYGYFKTGQWQAWDFNSSQPAERINVASDERSWIYRWQVAQLFKFFPPTEAVARSVSAVWGVITIFLFYWSGWYFTRRKTVGLISAFLFAVSVSGIEYNRHLRMYAMFFPIYLFFSLMLFAFFEEEYKGKINLVKVIYNRLKVNILYAIPAAIAAMVSFMVHKLTINIAGALLAYLAVQAVREYRKTKKILSKYSIVISIFITVFLVILAIKPAIAKSYLNKLQFFNNHWIYFTKIFSDYSHLLLAVPLIAIGLYFLWKQEEKIKEALWLGASLFMPLIMASFLWSRNVGDQYIFFLRSFAIILIATGIYAAAKFFQESMPKYGARAYLATIIIALVILPNYGYFFQENNTYRQTSSSENPNYRKIFAYVKKKIRLNDVIITRDFRNYYLSGANVKTFDFGGELAKDKFQLNDLQVILEKNQSGWIVFSGNDESYISNEAITFIEKNLTRISNTAVRGDVKVYQWGEKNN